MVSSHIVGRYQDALHSSNGKCIRAHSSSPSSYVSSIEYSNSFEFEMDSRPELDLSSNSAYDFAYNRQYTLELLDKASCYELLSKVLTIKSEILLQHMSLKTPSSHYHARILNLENIHE